MARCGVFRAREAHLRVAVRVHEVRCIDFKVQAAVHHIRIVLCRAAKRGWISKTLSGLGRKDTRKCEACQPVVSLLRTIIWKRGLVLLLSRYREPSTFLRCWGGAMVVNFSTEVIGQASPEQG